MKARFAAALSLALVCAATGFTSAGCSGKDDSPYYGTPTRHGKDVHTFYVNNGGEPEYIDPGKAHDTASTKIINHLFEGLAGYGPEGTAVPAAATHFERTPDNLYFRFHLREDGRWSDGKPVTAQDFEYAWKRVQDPATASLSSANLYWIKNAELFNQGKLLVAQSDTEIRETSAPDGKVSGNFAKGGAVLLLTRSPVAVSTTIPAFDAPPVADSLSYDAPNLKKKLPEKLVLNVGIEHTPVAANDAKRLPPGDYDVAKLLGPTSCNGAADYFFEVVARDGSGKRGVLPGCMLGASKVDDQRLLVAKWDALPTFDPKKRIEPTRDAPPIGFVAASAFKSDTSVLGVRAVDDRTLELEAEYPVPYMLDVLCATSTFPVRKDIVEPFKERGEPDMWTRPASFVGNGPYIIDQWKFRYEIRMTRSPHHRFYEKLQIRDIVWMAVESYVSTMNLYKAGEIDYIGDNSSLPPPYLPVLAGKKDYERTNFLATYWYEINTKVPPLDNVKVRQALNLAIDKPQFIEKVTRGRQTPATHFVPGYTGGGYDKYVESLGAEDPFASDDRKFNPERARQLLTEAGFPVKKIDGGYLAEGMPSIELLYNTSEGHKALAVAIQSMWKDNLGVSVSLRNEEWQVMQKNVRDGNFQIVRYGWVGEFDHPQTFLETFMAQSPSNRTGWSSQKFESLMAKARTTSDTTESMRLYREAELIPSDEVPKIPLYFYSKTTLVKPYVKGFHFNRRNEHMIYWLWIDENWENNSSDEPAFAVDSFPEAGAY